MATSHAERHDAGLAIRAQLWGDATPEATATEDVTTSGSVGVWRNDYVFGEVWSRPALTLRDRALAALVASAVLGHAETTERYAEAAARLGVTGEELDSVVGHLLAYGGEPAADVGGDAIAVAAGRAGVTWPVTDAVEPKDDERRVDDGYDVMRTIGGGRVPPDAAAGLGWFTTNLHDLGPLVYQWAFGEVWSHGPLSRRDRSLLVIAINATVGVEHELRTHVSGGLHHGLSRAEVEEILLSISAVIGIPRSSAALRIVWQLWATLDENAG